jgi:hypothetical protein
VPQIISQELQNDPEYTTKIKPIIGELRKDVLFQTLSDKRDFIVHKTQLDYKSTGVVGSTEIRMDKFTVTFPIDPKESSLDAYFRFVNICKKHSDFRALFGPDCDSVPFIKRSWRLKEFDDEFFDVCASLFACVATATNKVLEVKGAITLDHNKLDVGKASEVSKLLFDRDQFFEYMKQDRQPAPRADGDNVGEEVKIYLPAAQV